jgi:hypothetical protein
LQAEEKRNNDRKQGSFLTFLSGSCDLPWVLISMTNTSFFLFLLCAIFAVFFLFLVSSSYGMKLNESDFIITGFGINNSNPYITVEGTAGGSYDPSLGDEGYYAYVFNTDKGIFQITVSEGSLNKPYYGVDRIANKEIKLHECLNTQSTTGKPAFENKMVTYIGHNMKITKVNKALTILVTSDDPDERCKTGQHVQRILPNQNQTNAKPNTNETNKQDTSPVGNKTSVGASPGSVDINTSSGEYRCNGSRRMGKVNGLFVDAYNRHGIEGGQWTLVNEKSNGEDTNGNITGGSVSELTYSLTGKTTRDMICPTIYDKIVISGECGEGKVVEMRTSSGKEIASLKGNARCLPG